MFEFTEPQNIWMTYGFGFVLVYAELKLFTFGFNIWADNEVDYPNFYTMFFNICQDIKKYI